MKVTIEVNLKPFQVPDFVLVESEAKPRQEGMTEAPRYALSELSAYVLEELCEQFTKSVFEKAGKCRSRARQHVSMQPIGASKINTNWRKK